MAEPQSRYRYPFTPRDFYYLPVEWLRSVATTGDLDARDVLMYWLDDHQGDILIPPHAPEIARDARQRAFVSHVTFFRCLDDLLAVELLAGISSDRRQFHAASWPQFGGLGLVYRPRSYISGCWARWFGKNRWAPRAALLGLLGALEHTHRVRTDTRIQEPLEVRTTDNEVRNLVQRLLQRPAIAQQVGQGLRHLEGLGVVQVLGRGANSTHYRMKVSALDTPPDWRLEDIVEIGGLPAGVNEVWPELVAACLRLTFRPLSDAPFVWNMLRQERNVLQTDDDARDFLVLVERQASHTVEGLRRTLADFVKTRRQEARRNWKIGEEFWLSAKPGDIATMLRMPVMTARHAQATALIIRFERGRLSIADVTATATATELLALQDGSLIPLAQSLPTRRTDVIGHLVVPCNHLHTGPFDYARPFDVVLRCGSPQPSLRMRCHFEVLLPHQVPPTRPPH